MRGDDGWESGQVVWARGKRCTVIRPDGHGYVVIVFAGSTERTIVYHSELKETEDG